jgi:hypothetical protein
MKKLIPLALLVLSTFPAAACDYPVAAPVLALPPPCALFAPAPAPILEAPRVYYPAPGTVVRPLRYRVPRGYVLQSVR